MRSSNRQQLHEKLLRGLIREHLLFEVPLDYIVSDEERPPQPRHVRAKDEKERHFTPSIGHNVLKDPENRAAAVDYFRRTGESWAIVTLGSSEVDQPDRERAITDPDFVDNDEFREKLRSWGIDPERTNVIVVVGVPYHGDNEDVRWSVIHDIVGHSIEREVTYGWSYSVKQTDHFIAAAVNEVWDNLPEDFQIARTENKDDISSDIAAAIFLGNLSEDELHASATAGFNSAWDTHKYYLFMAHFNDDKEEARRWFVPQFVRTWTRAVENWKSKFDREGGRVRGILPFN